MAKRISREEIVMDFFQEATFDKAETLFNLVRGVMKKRTVKEGKAPAKHASNKKKDKTEPASAQPSLPSGGYQETSLKSADASKAGSVATGGNQSLK